jgi:hypothetical protein
VFESPRIFALSALAVTAAVAVRFVLFRASCALADAGEPGVGRSLALVIGVLALSAGLALLPGYLYPAPADEPGGAGRLVAAAAAVTAGAALAAVVYSWFLPTSLRRGAVVAASELLLGALLTCLVAGVVLVVLAGVQLGRRPEAPRRPTATPSALPGRPA